MALTKKQVQLFLVGAMTLEKNFIRVYYWYYVIDSAKLIKSNDQSFYHTGLIYNYTIYNFSLNLNFIESKVLQ